MPRFALGDSTCGVIQLGLLHVLAQAEMQENLASLATFGISVQVDFVLSQLFAWRDRWAPRLVPFRLVSRLLAVNAHA